MNKEQFMQQIDQWFEADEHQKIADAILALPEGERDDELLGQLAVAYNNLSEYEEAIAVLEQLRPRLENTDKWQFRMGYALYYLDRNQEAKVAFTHCLMLNGEGEYTEDCQEYLEWIEEEMEYKQANNAQALFELFELMEDDPSLVCPDRDNCCDNEGGLSEVLMDSAALHIESIVEKQLPVEEITAYNHLAIYLRWCIEQGLVSDLFKERLPKLVEDVESGKHTLDLREQLRDREELNQCLIRPYFNGDGAAFAAYYYSGKDEDTPYFPSDIDSYAKGYFGEKRYHSDEFQDEAYLFVPFDEAYYQGMKQVMDGRYAAWQALKAKLAENTAPSAQAQAMMRYLDCPCKYFAPTLDDDEIFAAYHEAAARGRKEGFVPLLVSAEDDDMNWDEEVLGTMEGSEAQNRFISYWEYGTSATVPLILAEIPVQNPWEVFAYLPFGGWNDCPNTPELMAVTKYWYEKHGAVPAVMTHDVLEFALPLPVKQDNAMQLALEQYAWCPDVIDQGGEDATVGMLADSLTKSKCWYFWWD